MFGLGWGGGFGEFEGFLFGLCRDDLWLRFVESRTNSQACSMENKKTQLQFGVSAEH